MKDKLLEALFSALIRLVVFWWGMIIVWKQFPDGTQQILSWQASIEMQLWDIRQAIQAESFR